MANVRDATYALLRELGLAASFNNPGLTEETFLKNFPTDFTHHLALQEASAVAMADGYAQVMRKPDLVNLHTAAGLGNAMGILMTAAFTKTPLIITAGRERSRKSRRGNCGMSGATSWKPAISKRTVMSISALFLRCSTLRGRRPR